MLATNSSTVPDRIAIDSTVESIRFLDEYQAVLAKTLSIEYVDSYRSFCNLEGCLATVRVGESKDLTIYDDNHLTPAAARFLVSENIDTFFGKTNESVVPKQSR